MKTPLIIGIAGGSASGKTTVTHKILDRLEVGKVVVLRHDYYYKDISTFDGIPPEQINFDHPNTLETSLLVEHLNSLRHWQPIQQPVYDYTTYRRIKETTCIEAKNVIIAEGI